MMKSDYASFFNPGFSLEPRKTALLVIDMQYATACRTTGLRKLLKEKGQEELGAYRFDRIEKWVVPNTLRLLDFFRKHGLKVIYITVGSESSDYGDLPPNLRPLAQAVENREGCPNHRILDELKPLHQETVLNKVTMSAFNSSSIDSVLRSAGIEYLIFTGVSTNSCVEGTARDAADKGYKCIIAEDACGAASESLHLASLENFKRLLGRVETVRTITEELEKDLNLLEDSRRQGSRNEGDGKERERK
jgi:nicotinamidase-related amidase